MRFYVSVYACMCTDEKQILLLGSYYFELTYNNLQNNRIQILKGKQCTIYKYWISAI